MTLKPHNISASDAVVHIWPGEPAMKQAVARAARLSPGGVLLLGDHFTQDRFLPQVVAMLPAQGKAKPLGDLAGALLVQRLLHSDSARADTFQGLRQGWRLPSRLWRLLVEIRAGGLNAGQLRELGGERSRALAKLLGEYEQALAGMGLEDQADGIRRLEQQPERLRLPWSGLVFHDVLWLRSLDMRLIRILSKTLPVEIGFSLPPQDCSNGGLAGLQRNSAEYLEASGSRFLDIKWQYAQADNAMARLVGSLLAPGGVVLDDPPCNVELVQAPGRYGEVELMLRKANELVANGAGPHEIALAFPDLDIYGQMVADVAGRMGLPVNISGGSKLSSFPLVSGLLALLALPSAGYPRAALADALDSPLLGRALCKMLGCWYVENAEFLLRKAGYIDGRETPPGGYLGGFDGRPYKDLAKVCAALQDRLDIFNNYADIPSFTARLLDLLDGLDLERLVVNADGRPDIRVSELKALDLLRRTSRDLAQAAETAQWDDPLSAGRLLSLLKQCLDLNPAPSAKGPNGGVQIMRLDQATGAKFNYLLVGGLALNEFPRQISQAAHVLSSDERMALGRKAGLPIWRTDDEEYSGQMMRLAGLMYAAEESVMLCCPAADTGGAELEPAYLMREVSRLTGMEVTKSPGGVFGSLPGLDECNGIQPLMGSLAADLAGGPPGDLAKAILHWLGQDKDMGQRWQEISQKAATESARTRLDALTGRARIDDACEYDGAVGSTDARGLLHGILADPDRRKVSPSMLETYAQCPMCWFLARLLGIRLLDEPGWGVSGSQEGEMVHAILAAFFRPEEFDPTWDFESRRERLAQCLEAEFSKHGGGHPFARQARRLALDKYLASVIEQQWLLFSGGMVPVAVEEDISGEKGNVFEVAVADGEPLIISGRLDRLDADPAEQYSTLRVVDYKHSNNSQNIKNMANTKNWLTKYYQMPIYMAASARARGPEVKNIQGLMVATRKPFDSPKPVGLAADDPLINGKLVEAVAGLWSSLSGGDFVAAPSPEACKYCEFSGACRARVNPAAEEGGEA